MSRRVKRDYGFEVEEPKEAKRKTLIQEWLNPLKGLVFAFVFALGFTLLVMRIFEFLTPGTREPMEAAFLVGLGIGGYFAYKLWS